MNGLLYDSFMCGLERLGLRRLRRELVARAQGDTLEIGAGTGLNLPFYPPRVRLIALEPDPAMFRRARAREVGRKVEFVEGSASILPFEEARFDTVVATLVFCSLKDPEQAVQELRRVLKPGGKLLLLEHVRPPVGIFGALADWLTPGWKRVAGGCHLNRRPEKWLRAAGFEIDEYRPLWRGFGGLWVFHKPMERPLHLQ